MFGYACVCVSMAVLLQAVSHTKLLDSCEGLRQLGLLNQQKVNTSVEYQIRQKHSNLIGWNIIVLDVEDVFYGQPFSIQKSCRLKRIRKKRSILTYFLTLLPSTPPPALTFRYSDIFLIGIHATLSSSLWVNWITPNLTFACLPQSPPHFPLDRTLRPLQPRERGTVQMAFPFLYKIQPVGHAVYPLLGKYLHTYRAQSPPRQGQKSVINQKVTWLSRRLPNILSTYWTFRGLREQWNYFHLMK